MPDLCNKTKVRKNTDKNTDDNNDKIDFMVKSIDIVFVHDNDVLSIC